jgi:hypothetical protein
VDTVSAQARQDVVDSPNTIFQRQSQRDDLLNESLTDSNLIALIQHLLACGHTIGFTAIRSDHHIDGNNGHNPGGIAFDGWPLKSTTAGDWMDANDPAFRVYLQDVASFSGIWQIGLAGTADTDANRAATDLPYEAWKAPQTVFSDEGADHVHHGAYRA